MLRYTNKNLNEPESRNVYKSDSFAWAKVRHHRFRAGKPLNVTKVGVAKHKVGGAAASPTVGRYRKLHP